MTQANPTNFHVFTTQKVLGVDESIADWREVTAAEKTKLEASDAAWVRPPQEFIDQWNAACGQYGRYNEATGFFELNELVDITYAQALEIYENGRTEYPFPRSVGYNCRTNMYSNCISARWVPSHDSVNIDCLFTYCYELETVRVSSDDLQLYVNKMWALFRQAKNVRKVLGTLWVGGLTSISSLEFENMAALEEIRLSGLKCNLPIKGSPKLSLESVKYMVEKATNTATITISVHADVYAKLNDEQNTEWYAVREAAAAKNISFAA